MTSTEHMIDPGEDTYSVHFKLDTEGLEAGRAMAVHIPGEQLRDAFSLKHLDLLNAHKMGVSVNTPVSNTLGVSLSHGDEGEIPLNTHSRAILVDHSSGTASGFHTISTHARVPHEHELKIFPTEKQIESAANITKRLGPKWADMNVENISAGAWKATIKDKPVVLVTESGANGVKSSIHRLLVSNENNTKLYEGAYTKGKREYTEAPDGRQAIIMKKEDYDHAHAGLHEILSIHSPFQHGLTAQVTNVGTHTITAKGPTMVNVKIHRKALDTETGLVVANAAAVHSIDISRMAGGDTAAKRVALPYDKAEPYVAEAPIE